MVLVAGAAFWAGGLVWQGFLFLIALGLTWEWARLAIASNSGFAVRALWLAAGLGYIGFAALTLSDLRQQGPHAALGIIMQVIAVDIGAYFAGRAIGGPRIAPRISPSKTWAGLVGGMVAAALLMSTLVTIDYSNTFGSWPWQAGGTPYAMTAWLSHLRGAVIGGVVVAVIAQSGDFFESWMKRRAGAKDSGTLLPGHGGLFDRLDGLLAVLFVYGIFRDLGLPFLGGF
jgi:phosphatidate cytidylyltransferase